MAEDNTMSEDAKSTASPTPTERDPDDKGNFMPLVFGGAVATMIGFFAAQLDGVERALGLAPEDSGLAELVEQQGTALTEQKAVNEAQASAITDLQSGLAAVPAPPPPVDLSGLESSIADGFAALETRIVALEKRPMTEGLSPEAVAAYEAELLRLQAAVDTQRAEIETLLETARNSEASAARKAQTALARAALTGIITAVDSGKPFPEALAELDAAGGADVPQVLRDLSGTGVPTLSGLQAGFPAAARASLAASRADEAANGEGGIGSFLQRQLGARSVTPQDGDSTDAVLSRAEAAVTAGQIGSALNELGSLSETAAAPMADWIDTAQTRHAATLAADELLTALSTN